ncbi:hypothetical protein BGZ60DRAFT_103824 [Tricladium varicosporioides]|nr:hypothetical protein BGZ60DRAFT_103824 [Hymenoscyphus varicosporioides]
MHGSSTNGLRPRQRTFTSCTECRRRKQKCNQAKDRPCNNCSRRYPQPLCTYQSSSPTPPPMEQMMDFRSNREGHHSSQTSRSNDVPSLAYVQPPQFYSSHTATTVPNQTLYSTSTAYHSPSLTLRSDTRGYQGEGSSGQQINTSAAGSDVFGGGYYPTDQVPFSVTDSAQEVGYYTTSDQPQWLSGGDPDVFIGAGEYYYVDDSEPPRPSGSR